MLVCSRILTVLCPALARPPVAGPRRWQLREVGLSQKPLDYRARLLRNPKKTLEEVLRVTAPTPTEHTPTALADDTLMWGLGETELQARVDALRERCHTDQQLAELHEALVLNAGGWATATACAPEDGATPNLGDDTEGEIKAALTIFMAAWVEWAAADPEARRLADTVEFEADQDWAAIRTFDEVAAAAAVGEGGGEAAGEAAHTEASAGGPLDLFSIKRQWDAVTHSEDFVDLGTPPAGVHPSPSPAGSGSPAHPIDHTLAAAKRELQASGAVPRLYRRVVAELAGLKAASERDALQLALHTLVGITELTLHRTTAMDEARTYWLSQEASYHASRLWYGERADDIRWLLG